MRRTAACLLFCLLAPALLAQDVFGPTGKDWAGEHAEIYLDEALISGDLDAHALTLAKLIETRASVAALRRWDVIESQVSNPAPVYNALSALGKDNFKACGEEADLFADAWVRLARRFSNDTSWQKVAREWGGVTEAAYAGPFADGTASAHDDVFPPEVMLDFGAEYEGVYGRIGWAPVRHFRELNAELDMYDQKRWAGYCYYIATALVSDVDRPALIKLKLSGPSKAWLNGQCVLSADARAGELQDEFYLRVDLKRGRNVLLVKLGSISKVRIRVRDENGQPSKNILTVRPKAGDKRVVMSGGLESLQAGTPKELVKYELLGDQMEEAGDKKWLAPFRIAYAVEAEARGLSDRANWAAESAAGLAGDQPLLQLAFLECIDKGRLFSSSERRKLTRSITDGLIASDPKLIPAVFRKADLLATDERFREAVELLRGALEHTPAKWRVHLKLARVFRDAGWVPEQQAAIRAALEDAPKSLPVLAAASDFYASVGALGRETELDEARLAILPGDPDSHLSLANTLSRTADLDGSIRHWRVLVAGDPGNDFTMGRLAEALAGNGKLAEALEVYETLSAQSPRPEEGLYQAARVCLQLGREEQGARYLERVLEVDPGHHLARRELQRMRGESENFWSGYTVKPEEIATVNITREQFPRAASAMVLDELVQYVYADGSSISYVHQIRKILTQDGVDARGKERIPGELVNARTIQPDGTIIEPITQPGGLIEFPGVKIGALLDVEYVQRSDGGPLHTLDGDAFYFVDQRLAEPFGISRWVVIAPKQMNFNVIYHNLRADDPGVTISEQTRDSEVVRVWDVRNPRMPEIEQFMPTPLEVIPWIEFVQPRDWRIRARNLADEGLRQVMNTPLIRERAAELTEGLETDEDKARAIYRWVNTTFTTAGSAWNAHQALKEGAGEREEVFISLCSAAGVELGFAYIDPAPAFKSPPEESLPRPHWAYPNKDDFDAMSIVVRRNDGALAWLDMHDRLRPFGEVPARLANAPAILWMAGEYSLTFLPGTDREKDRFENKVHIKLAADGSASLEGSITIRGERSYALKDQMRNTPNDELCSSLEADLAQHYKGFEVSECLFPRLGDVGEPLVQEYKGEVRKLADVTKDGLSLTLPGEKLGRLLSILVGARKREFDIALTFDLVQRDELRIGAPEGYAFAEVPKDLVYPTAPLTYELKFRVEDGDLVVTRKLVLGPGRFKPAEYNDLVEQIKQIKQSEDSVLKLVKKGS
ncbi:MAG: tetratricopeptide repeat protein [Planctomycetes bacterium]|nr:tetratricopeptide repeat protein [Planctomycetota bacterium]